MMMKNSKKTYDVLRFVKKYVKDYHIVSNGKEICVNCLWCSVKDYKKKLTVNAKTGLFHCFAGDTRVITYDGVYPIQELCGKTVKLLTENSVWVDAPIEYFGKQNVVKLVLIRDKIEKVIFVTEEHDWFVKKNNGLLVKNPTNRLRIDDILASNLVPSVKFNFSFVNIDYWIARGFVFGDGTTQKYKKDGPVRNTVAYFHGKKDNDLLKYFNIFNKKCYYDERRKGHRIGGLPADFKDLPINASLEELYFWLIGYFAADGCVKKHGCVELASANIQNLIFVKNICLKLGITTFNIRKQLRLGFNKKEKSFIYYLTFASSSLKDEFFILSTHLSRFNNNTKYERVCWRVKDIEYSKNNLVDVYCAVVPNTHNFTLEDNILTGNCWKCLVKGNFSKFSSKYAKSNQVEHFLLGTEFSGVNRVNEIETQISYPEYFRFLSESSAKSLVAGPFYDYLFARGITALDIDYYNIGFCNAGKLYNRVVVPVYSNDVLVSYIARAITDIKPKVLTPPSLKGTHGVKDYVFNIDRAKDTKILYIGEGVFDSIALGVSGICLFGKEATKKQLATIINTKPRRIVVCLDGDAYKYSVKLASQLLLHCNDVRIAKFPEDKDPASLDKFSLPTFLTSAEKYEGNLDP